MTTAVATPPDARCLGCDYSLHGLLTRRCPECGRDFDPGDHWTMNVSRPHGAVVRFLLSPVGLPTRLAAMLGTGAFLWWALALPHSAEALAAGFIVWSLVYLHRIGRWIVRRVTARVYRHRVKKKRRFTFLILISLCASMLATRWPLRVMFALQRSSFDRVARHYYEESPMLAPPPAPSRVGVYPVSAIQVSPTGVTIELNLNRAFYYSPNADKDSSNYWWYPIAGVNFDGGWSYYSSEDANMLMIGYPALRWYYRLRYGLGI